MAKPPTDHFIRRVAIDRIVDGDTIAVKIDLGFTATLQHHIRLARVNTPEPRGFERPAGDFVTSQVKYFVGTETDAVIHSRVFKIGKFDRCICDLWVDGRNLNEWLLEQGFAWRTDEGGSLAEDRKIDSLFGIPEQLRNRCRELAA